jgi:hypothetical protein
LVKKYIKPNIRVVTAPNTRYLGFSNKENPSRKSKKIIIDEKQMHKNNIAQLAKALIDITHLIIDNFLKFYLILPRA